MAETMLLVQGLRKSFGGIVAVDDVDLSVDAGEVHAIIGPNGAGKTTLVSLLGGALEADAGSIVFRDREIVRLPAYQRARQGIARSFQITSIFHDMTVLENVVLAVLGRSGHSSLRLWRRAAGDPALISPAQAAIATVGLQDQQERRAGDLSHGEHRQLEMAMALATAPSLLLLDEPMAGMGPEESIRMVALIGRLRHAYAILLIEHDMDAVFALADCITVMVNGRVIASGSPHEIRADAAVRQAYLGDDMTFDA